jgi:cellulose synthase/poly-beta-1,6-N-acetylglucosamine synthase-like glycosyltransferase
MLLNFISDIILFFQNFITNFIEWLKSISFINLLLLLWPYILIDFSRSIGKSIILLFHSVFIKKEEIPTVWPKISIIIPARNEEKFIRNSIQAALEADYPNKEIIIIDDGSTDRTFEIASSYIPKGIKVFRRNVPSGSKGVAINHGIVHSTGDIILSVDADTIIEYGSLKELIKKFNNPNVLAVSGNVRILTGENGKKNILTKFQAYEYLLSMETGRRYCSLLNTLIIIPGAMGAFRRKECYEIGLFDKDIITEDFDITIKIRKINGKIVFADKAISWTYCPDTWRKWIRQRIRWSYGQIETLWKHRNTLFKYHFQNPFVAAFYDMIFMDIILLFIRLLWMPYLLIFYINIFPYLMTLTFLLYLLNEVIIAITAGLLSPRKEDIKYFYLVPFIILFYRPFYSLIRFIAYIKWLLKRKAKW